MKIEGLLFLIKAELYGSIYSYLMVFGFTMSKKALDVSPRLHITKQSETYLQPNVVSFFS